MRSLTVQPSLQGTTTPVCPNVTVTFIIAVSASSKTQAPLDGWWLMDDNAREGSLTVPQKVLIKRQGDVTKQEKK